MRTIAIVNQKGGCGKTTTAINLAAVLARRGLRTLLVDMDPQSHCAAGLGVPESAVQRGVGEVLLGDLDHPLEPSTFLWEVSRNLHLAPSTVSLAALEAAAGGLSGLPDRDRRLGRMLQWLAPRFDIAIVDCPPTIGLLTFNALRAAEEAIVPVETGYFSLRGAEKQVATIQRIVERLGRPIHVRLLATLYDDTRPVDREVLDQLRKKFGESVLPMVVADHEVLREAASVGSAVTEFAPRSAAESDFDALAAWLLDHPPVAPALPVAPEQPRIGEQQSVPRDHAPASRVAAHPLGAPVGFHARALGEFPHREPDRVHERRGIEAGRGIEAAEATATDAPPSTRAAELARRVRDLNGRPSAEEIAMLTEPARRTAGDMPREVLAAQARTARPEIRLALPRGLAFRVAVIGDFNAWTAETLELRADSGVFEFRRDVKPGRYRYRLLVDGREALDPTNALREVGPDGRDVSVVEVGS
jgi:chromosome partitioning protein